MGTSPARRRGAGRAAAARAGLTLALGGMLLAGCVGDFGRSEPSLLAQRVGLDPYVHVPGFAASAPGHLPMTADEAELRLRAYGLTFVYAHEPSYGHATDFAPLMPRNLRHRSFPTAGGYAAAIGNLGHRSPEARLNAIIDDIRADLIQTDHFHRAAVEVYATDANRLHDLRALGAAPAPEGEVVARIEENRFVVERTLVALDERVAGYELAMGESVFGGVGKARAAAVLELDGLRRRVARLGFELARLDARHGLTLPVAEPCTERSLAREC